MKFSEFFMRITENTSRDINLIDALDLDEAKDFFSEIENEIFLKFGTNPFELLVTSPSGGDGKTTVALLMGVYSAMANPEANVLLIDPCADHALTSALCKEPKKSIASYKKGSKLDECLCGTTIANLKVAHIFAGGYQNLTLPYESLESFLESAKKDYQRIIVDSAAVSKSKDVIALARMISNVALVVRYSKTKRQQAQAMLEQLASVDCEIMGTILNRRIFPLPKILYGI